jgi:NAD-dependent deacetylase
MIIAFTGAGISKESGIATFQEKNWIRDCLTRSYAQRHPEKYRAVMRDFVASVSGKEPNDAHIALAEYDIPVLTMNVDTLHEQAGTKTIVKMHGRLPTAEELPYCDKLYNTPVLYEDPAPAYQEAYEMLDYMTHGDVLLVIGASHYTTVSTMMRTCAMMRGATVVEIQDSASTKVREYLEANKDKIKSFEERKRNFDALDWRE